MTGWIGTIWPRTTITADRGGIAAGRDVIQGIPPDQLPAIIAAATDPLKQLNDAQQSTIAALEHRLSASEAQVLMFFRIIGESHVPLEQVDDRLVEIAERYNDLLVEVQRKPSDDPVVVQLKTEAHAALEAGDFDRADALLEKVLAAQDAASARRQLEAAATSAQRGDIALTRLRYLDAADHFAAAAARVPLGHGEDLADYGNRRAEALYRYGDEKGDTNILLQAINVLKALQQQIGKRMPPKWADETSYHLNILRYTLGEHMGHRPLLKEAENGFRLLLENPISDRKPLQQAGMQICLNLARLKLGEFESSTAQQDKALRAALDELTPNRVVLLGAEGMATAAAHLGIVAAECGERDSGPRGTGLLEGAVQAFRCALDLQTFKQLPRGWAGVQTNLGAALSSLGERDEGPKGTALLEHAVKAFRAALEKQPREQMPLEYARTQFNLGTALSRLGERDRSAEGAVRLKESIEAYEAALEEFTPKVPLWRAATLSNLGVTRLRLGQRTQDQEKFEEAREAIKGALKVYLQAGQEHRREYFEDLLGKIDEQIRRLPPS